MFNARDLHWEIYDLFAGLTGVPELHDPEATDAPGRLRPLAGGRKHQSCSWVPPRRAVEREAESARPPKDARDRVRAYWASLPMDVRRAKIAARPPLTAEQKARKAEKERERYWALRAAPAAAPA